MKPSLEQQILGHVLLDNNEIAYALMDDMLAKEVEALLDAATDLAALCRIKLAGS